MHHLPTAMLACCALAAVAADTTITLPLEAGECWWGGHAFCGRQMPYSAKAPFAERLAGRNRSNQFQSLLVSSTGRFVWCDEPIAFAFKDGTLTITAPQAVVSDRAGRTLRDGFRAAAQRFFPATGTMPDERLFTAPQWNTWIELTYHQNEQDVLRYAQAIIDQGFPPGVLMIDDTWQEAYGTWTFHPGRFRDPRAMMDRLHTLGFATMLWVCPFVSADTPAFRALDAQKGVLYEPTGDRPALFRWWNGYSACVDLSHPAGKGWMRAQLDRLRKDYGADGFKFDAGDAEIYQGTPYRAHDAAQASPHAQSRLWGQLGLDHPLNEYRTVWQLAGQPLAQRLQDKSHDWQDLGQLIPDILAQGLLGYAFTCPDMIGGGQWLSFQPGAQMDQKLIVRSAQTHALMAMMQFSVAPWRILDRRHLDAIKACVALRQKHVPTILALARAGATSGEPIIRHLAYVFPGEGFEEVKDQFMLGDGILVAPVLTADDRRSVRLPAGRWLADDGTTHTGPATLTLTDVPLERLPHFIHQ